MKFDDNLDYTEFWRWKLMRKMAAFIHEPDHCNSAELMALINQYQNINNFLDQTRQLDSAS